MINWEYRGASHTLSGTPCRSLLHAGALALAGVAPRGYQLALRDRSIREAEGWEKCRDTGRSQPSLRGVACLGRLGTCTEAAGAGAQRVSAHASAHTAPRPTGREAQGRRTAHTDSSCSLAIYGCGGRLRPGVRTQTSHGSGRWSEGEQAGAHVAHTPFASGHR